MDDGGQERDLEAPALEEAPVRRRRRWSGAAAAVVAAGAVAALVVVPSDDGRSKELATEVEVDAAQFADPVELADSTTTTTDLASAPPPEPPAGDVSPTTVKSTTSTTAGRSAVTTSPAAATTTAAGPVCQNSRDPACGPFFWDPQPPTNQPLTASWVAEVPSRWNTRNGRMPMEYLRYQWNDPDSFMIYQYLTINRAPVQRDCTNPDPQYGPWAPPEPHPSAGSGVPEIGDVGLMPTTGTAEIHLALGTGACGYRDPYSSAIVLTATVEMYYE